MLVVDKHNQELVLMGKGLGFDVRANDTVNPSMIEKVFRIEDKNTTSSFGEYIAELTADQLSLTENIITYATSVIDATLSDYLYLGLTDHIDFIVSRIKSGLIIRNPLIWEIKKAYPKEYDVGEYALKIIEKHYNIQLPQDEAASIALHIVNAQKSLNSINYLVKELDIIQDLLRIVRYHFAIDLDEDSINFERFFIHLKFFVYRVKNNKQLSNKDNSFYQTAIVQWENTFDCVSKMVHYLEQVQDVKVSDDEKFYLMVHIHRLSERE